MGMEIRLQILEGGLMSKDKNNGINKSKNNKQEKLTHYANSVPGDNRNQNHNVKKEGLGPNTNR